MMSREAFLFFTRIMLIGILLCMASGASAKEDADTLILERIYAYRKANLSEFESKEDNVYTKIRYNVERRNATLWLIPSMYVMAKDPRDYIRGS